MDLDKYLTLLRATRVSGGRPTGRGRELADAADQELAAELMAERASSLARASRRLTAACERVWDLHRRITADATAAAELGAAYEDALKVAGTARWELIVQREALGLRSHHDFDQDYALPRPGLRS